MNDTVKSTLAPEAPDLPAWRRVAALERDRAELIEALQEVEQHWQEVQEACGEECEVRINVRVLLSRLEKDRT